MTRHQQAVLTPLVFFDCFDRPLLKNYLLQAAYLEELTRADLEETLGSMTGIVKESQDYLYLADRKGLIENAKLRRRVSFDFWHEAKLVTAKLASLPFVRMVAVVNSLSFWNVGSDSDIDLLVVTEPDYLPIARDHANVLLKILGKRNDRPPKTKKVAIDIWLTTNNLEVKSFRNAKDIYLDFWASHLTPVFDQGGVYKKFLAANPWIKETFPNFLGNSQHLIDFSYRRRRVKTAWENLFRSFLGKKISQALTRHQLVRLKKYQDEFAGQGTIVIDAERMRFNTPDRRVEYQERFDERWEQVSKRIN